MEEEKDPINKELDATIKKKFQNYSLKRLIKKINAAPDFGYDDEEYELGRRGREQGFETRWNDSLSKPKILIKRKGETEFKIFGD